MVGCEKKWVKCKNKSKSILTIKINRLMNYQRKILFIYFIILIGVNSAYSQCNTVTGGGIGIGSGGSSSFVIGRVFCLISTNEKENDTKRIQQASKVSAFKNENLSDILLDMNIFPNPTSGNVVLKINNVSPDLFNYELYDLLGRVITSRKVKSNETIIQMDKLVDAMYVLKVNRNNLEVKTFKIIKNSF